jgi:arylformamidase
MPLHFFDGAADTDSLDLSVLIGLATVIEVPEEKNCIDAAFLASIGLRDVTRVLFKTFNSRLWNNPYHSFVNDYVALAPDGAHWLVEHGCRLVGIDYISIAPFEDSVTPHEILLSNNVVILETLDLREAQPGEYQLICLPLKLISREAAPCRAILLPTL